MIETRVESGVAVLRFQRPEAMNAMSFADLEALTEAFRASGADASTGALVLTGTGSAFTAGADLRAYDADNVIEYAREGLGEVALAFAEAVRNCPKPVVTAVNGLCFGGGVGIALMADVTVAARSAYFVMPQVRKMGFTPDLAGAYFATLSAGRARALGMAVTGDKVTAEQAAGWGLIWSCVDDDALMTEAVGIARRLAHDPEAAVATRRLVDDLARHSVREQLLHERDHVVALLSRPHALAAVTDLINRRAL
ncbi:enoyl-CoA hydratase/isomerase family protein [Nocardioides limicola]|uniref:enoyl-CoA hydratase/isomerase family protein n=1 Tax=Nocardioides limicola TaxID=2803368 RepID=UPI00193C7E8F|nr:enoyl-CoA hydratase/isomerase family protein [Nocardioides sp. DJM-14]